MQGWMRLEADGTQHDFSFDLMVAARWREHLGNGKADAAGVTYAAPLAARAVTTGTMTIAPFGRRMIEYQLHFATADGQPARFSGKKVINWWRLKSSWTTLPGEIWLGDGSTAVRYATCELYFDVSRNWWSFTKSFF